METRPRPRGESLLTPRLIITVVLTGLVITVGSAPADLARHTQFGSLEVARSVAFTSFSLCLIVAALECRSETETVLTTATFDSKQMNWTILAEFALAVLVTQMDVFNRLLDTTPITLAQFGWALVPAVALLVLWELAKLLVQRVDARRRRSVAGRPAPPRQPASAAASPSRLHATGHEGSGGPDHIDPRGNVRGSGDSSRSWRRPRGGSGAAHPFDSPSAPGRAPPRPRLRAGRRSLLPSAPRPGAPTERHAGPQ